VSGVQRFFKALFPENMAADMEAESRKWMIRCPNCGHERSYWDVGGVRWKAAGNPRLYRRCPQCERRSWHYVYYKKDAWTQPPFQAGTHSAVPPAGAAVSPAALFLSRYEPLRSFYLAKVWETVDEAHLRRRPAPQLNSIVWNLWHINRAEDAGLSRFVANQAQVLDEVLDEGTWNERLHIPHRHLGTAMTLDEVDEFSRAIDIPALRAYSEAVSARTLAIVEVLDPATLAQTLSEPTVRRVLLNGAASSSSSQHDDEGVAGPQAGWLVDNYIGWSRGKCLIHFGLTHSYQHVGEIGVLGSLMGIDVYGV
jgi:hypothetical protein